MTRDEAVQEARKQRRGRLTERIVYLVGLGLAIVFTVMYVSWTQRTADERWCGLMTGLDDRYQKLQSPDPDAQAFARQVHEIRVSLPCDASPVRAPVAPSPSGK